MQTITKWEREGLPVAERGGRGRPSRYEEVAVRAWLKARDAGAEPSAFKAYHEAGARQRSALAALAELQLEERRGRLVDADAVAARVADMITACRTRLLCVPSRVKQARPHLTTDDVLAFDRCLRQALEDLAEGQVIERTKVAS